MKKILFFLLFVLITHGQEINVKIGITDGVKVDSLFVGLDQSATDGIDASLGEESLPPLPPSGVFDARLNIANNESIKRDYRTGGIGTVGNKVHEIQYQMGSGTSITLSWNLPDGITGRLNDIILGTLINVNMSGTGNYTVTNPSVFNKLKLTMTYNLAPPDKPLLVNPENNAVGISLTPNLLWNSQTGVNYSLQLASDFSFTQTIVNENNLSDTSYSLSALNNNSKYYWRIKASNNYGDSDWSDVFNFTTEYEVPTAPQLTAPENNSVDTELQIAFQWSDTETASTGTVSYDLLYSTSSDFSSNNQEVFDVDNTEYQLTSDLVSGTKYYWKVKSKNTTGESDWSEVFNFTTKVLLPQPPASVYPQSGSVNQSLTPELGWNSTEYADFYNLYVSTDSNFANNLYEYDSLTSTKKRLPSLESNTKYFWRLKAGNSYGLSEYSSTFYFTTTSITWQNSLLITNNSQKFGTLTFGAAQLATDNVDSLYGEVVLPPLPPSDIFDIRFAFPDGQDFSLNDFRSSESSVLEWEINIQGGTNGFPLELTWDNQKFPEGNFTLTDMVTGTIVNVDMKSENSLTLTNSAINKLLIKYSLLVCKNLEISAGWNLLSIPVTPQDASVSTLFPEANSNAYYFNNGYQTASEFEIYKGYWLRFPQTLSREICGDSPTADSIIIKSGWNLIGSFENDVELTNVYTYPSNIITSFFYGFNNGYTQANSLIVGKGYWVRANQDGVLKIAANPTNNKVNNNNDWASISIRDNSNSIRTLYITKSSIDNQNYELPPLPPDGIFDARFNDNSMLQGINNSRKQIILTNAQFPVKLAVSGTNLRFFDSNQSIDKIVRDGEEIVINNSNLNKIYVEEVLAPEEFELLQNYPNPFNPSTIIKYAIPTVIASEAKQSVGVTLKIYDILGNEVATLVNEQKEAGYYEAKFNAKNLSSGMYIYRIQAGDFISTKKMLLIK